MNESDLDAIYYEMLFPVVVTGRTFDSDLGLWSYQSTELFITDGLLEDTLGGRVNIRLVEVNNAALTIFPFFTWARFRGIFQSLYPIFEFDRLENPPVPTEPEYVPLWVVTKVCPVIRTISAGSGIDITVDGGGDITIATGSATGSADVVTGLEVERRLIWVPRNTLHTKLCLTDPEDCCDEALDECCPPPDTWCVQLSYYTSPCSCIPTTDLEMTYFEPEDAWYSEDLGAYCGDDELYLKVWCAELEGVENTWVAAIVDGDDEIAVQGVVSSMSCDPWEMEIRFNDTEETLCAGEFWFVAIECEASSGGEVSCVSCARNLASTLTVTLSDAQGTVTLTWDGIDEQWQGSQSIPCGVTLYLAFGLDCTLFYSCDNVNYNVATTFILNADCGPPFTASTYIMDLDNSEDYGCTPGCGTLTASISE